MAPAAATTATELCAAELGGRTGEPRPHEPAAAPRPLSTWRSAAAPGGAETPRRTASRGSVLSPSLPSPAADQRGTNPRADVMRRFGSPAAPAQAPHSQHFCWRGRAAPHRSLLLLLLPLPLPAPAGSATSARRPPRSLYSGPPRPPHRPWAEGARSPYWGRQLRPPPLHSRSRAAAGPRREGPGRRRRPPSPPRSRFRDRPALPARRDERAAGEMEPQTQALGAAA